MDIPATLARLSIGDEWEEAIADAVDRWDISTDQRAAMFLAQTLHESSGFTRLVENLNYSEYGLLNTFPKYFTPQQANDCARDDQRIANRVYANRLGNGDEASGDGWKYRGRGLIQITGRRNYERCGDALEVDLLASPELLERSIQAAESAGWFWSTNGCNELADSGAFASITRRINGGLNGQAEREAWLIRVRRAIT